MLKTVLIVVGCVVGVGLLAWLLLRKTPKKYYSKARRSHKHGEKSYKNKEFELADDYYQESERFRTKAKETKAKKGGQNA